MRGTERQTRRPGRRVVGVAAALAALAILAAVPAVHATDLEDLLWDLQVVPLDREPAPGFTLEDLDGGRLSLADLRGRVVFLYFWLTT